MQEVIIYIVLGAAVIYLVYRFGLKRAKKSCGGCAGACSALDLSKIDVEKTLLTAGKK